MIAETVTIRDELLAQTEKTARLREQTAAIQLMTPEMFQAGALRLEQAEGAATVFTKRVMARMGELHAEYNTMVRSFSERGPARIRRYVRYLTQAWYHTRYTPEFERRFGALLVAHIAEDNTRFASGNKFIRLIEEDADDELGHELWALNDIKELGGPELIDVHRDVLPEIRALVRTQFDRLTRLNFIGFLGYSFYLESWVARHSLKQLERLTAAGIPRSAQSFIFNHFAVDQSHAADNIELLNFLVTSDELVAEVIDNMEVIHTLYSHATRRIYSE